MRTTLGHEKTRKELERQSEPENRTVSEKIQQPKKDANNAKTLARWTALVVLRRCLIYTLLEGVEIVFPRETKHASPDVYRKTAARRMPSIRSFKYFPVLWRPSGCNKHIQL